MEVHTRLLDELETQKIFLLETALVPYLEPKHFSQSVLNRFPNATFDTDEAGKCLALDRPTACVFHLMRVTEHGLKAVSNFLSIKDPVGPNWDQILKKIDSELKANYEDRKFKGERELLAHISSNLHAVKVAWRNRTMHIDTKYTIGEAKEIFNATTAFMNQLAEKMPNA